MQEVLFVCPDCGRKMMIRGNYARKRCPDCAEIHKRQSANERKRQRRLGLRKNEPAGRPRKLVAPERPAPSHSIDDVLAYAKTHGLRGYDEARRALERLHAN